MMSGNPEQERPEPAEADDPTQLLRRIHEHKMVQWTIAYVALAYGIQHAVTLTSEALEWPHAVERATMILLILGVPVMMTLAWYQGARASRNFSQAELSILAAILALTSLLFYAFVQPANERTAPAAAQASLAPARSGVAAARQASLSPATAISLAVMPFENLSPDPNQGYFVDGMGDEIITALAKIPDLRVVGRESALQFKGKHENFRDVGRALNATHLIEGSVRKAGDQLRIAVELVRADNGVTIWSNAYDRQLKDVFAVQEDIARSIATSLHMTLGLKPGDQLVSQRAIDPELHTQYLRARILLRVRRPAEAFEGIRLLDDVVARAPNYAPAWAALAFAHQAALLTDADIAMGAVEKAKPFIDEHLDKMEAAAERAIKLDPNNAEAFCALAYPRADRRDQVAAMELRQRGLAIDPDDPECLQNPELAGLGFIKETIPIREHLLALEPFVPAYRAVTARTLFAGGETEAAIKILTDISGRGDLLLAQIYASQGRYREAADLLDASARTLPNTKAAKLVAAAAKILRAAPATPAPNERPELGNLDWVYFHTGLPERFMNTYENQLRMGVLLGGAVGPQWAPAYRSVRQTSRFKQWARDSGALAYWRAKGWPPQCHPTTGEDFVCE